MDIQAFYQKIGGFPPNPLQKAVWEGYGQAKKHPALLVKAGTGTGKTEAVLFPALTDSTESHDRRIIMVMPSKALIEDMGERVKIIGQRLTESYLSEFNITVDMGGSCRRYSCRSGKTETNIYHRHLFADDLIITTLDKFLFRIFGYGEKIKSFIFPHRVFGEAIAKKPFIIFDEAHEYDGLAFSNFTRLIETLFIKGKDLCVMSATLPEKFVDFLQVVDATGGELGKQQADFQNKEIISRDKHLVLVSANGSKAREPSSEMQQMSLWGDSKGQLPLFSQGSCSEDAIDGIVSAIAAEVRKRYALSKRIIARTESVKDLMELYNQLKDLNPLPYHGRMTAKQRSENIQKFIKQQKEEKGFLVLATSAIEAGCDLDAHIIVTELCNPDSLVQLAGRLNRRGQMNDAELVIVGEKIKSFVSVLKGEQVEKYVQKLKTMNGLFKPENLREYFNPPKGDWMGEILFDMLWDYVYEGDLTSKPLWDRGILVTRSWEPSVTLCTGVDKKTRRPFNPVQVGISRLAITIRKSPKDNPDEPYTDWLKRQPVRDKFAVDPDGDWHADLFKAFFNPSSWEESHWTVKPFTGKNVSCYETDLLCVIKEKYISKYFDENFGYRKLPGIFLKGYRDGFKQYLDYHPEFKDEGSFLIPSSQKSPKHSGRVWYLDRTED
jgi:CRISPR-associated endonuclease/helicase Cas3